MQFSSLSVIRICRRVLLGLCVVALFAHGVPCEAQAIIPKHTAGKRKPVRRIILRKSPIRLPKVAEEIQPERVPVIAPSTPTRPEAPEPRLTFHPSGYPVLESLDSLDYIDETHSYAVDKSGNKVFFTLDPDLQLKARSLLQQYTVPWGAIVAVEPRTGRILALASYSAREPNGPDVATRATFPAASLFKLVTASAAIEKTGMSGNDLIYFRGGNYTLERFNYLPDARLDRRSISFAEALGRSINPAFARVTLNSLSAPTLERYASNFGFNQALPFDGPVDVSHFSRPTDEYETARTGAGFGDVTLSPLHAAVITGTIANKGVMMRPFVVDRVVDASGVVKYQAHYSPVRASILGSTAHELLSMMESTVDIGTAKRQFVKVRNPFLKNVSIAAKTGTLSGDNPKGLYHWFVAAVPADRPEIAIATLVIDPGNARVKSSALAREVLEHYFRERSETIQTRSEVVRDVHS
ncbi:MAG: penicillin-binding transpeptidase domain-containing protein [Bdellovibrionota bacterium]